MVSDYIWLCNSLMDVRNWRSLMSDLAERDRPFAIEAGKRNDQGESLGPEYFPAAIWPTDDAKPTDTSAADFFYSGTHWIVSARFANLLRQFEMGDAHLYPVRFAQKDRETLLGDEYFCINFGNVKSALLPQDSKNLRARAAPPGKELWGVKATFGDDDIVFSEAALNLGAIWIDPRLANIVCIEAALGDAMRAQRIVKGFIGLGDMRKGKLR